MRKGVWQARANARQTRNMGGGRGEYHGLNKIGEFTEGKESN